ncbi:MAG: PAS domain-containing protein [Janthinobacterium lividum]
MLSDNRSPAAANTAFLQGGGLAAGLIRDFGWAATALGPIEAWPNSLKITVGFIVRSPVPIVMLWGVDGYMIYNDAYSSFAGGRHPRLLGCKVREGWPEVAAFNDNVMKVGLGGGTLAYRDQELVLHRSGVPERVWMNLDYSPVVDENGAPCGVLAIVMETTERVLADRYNAAEQDRLRTMFEQAPGFVAMLDGPTHVFRLANAAYLDHVGQREIVGRPVREALPELEGQGFYEQLDDCLATGRSFVGTGVRIRLQRTAGGPIEDRFVDFIYQPVLSDRDEITGIFLQGADVTERVEGETALRESERQLRRANETLEQQVAARTAEVAAKEAQLRAIFETSFGFHWFLAPDGTLLDTNATALDAVGASLADVVGRPLWDCPWFATTPGATELIRKAIGQTGNGATPRQEIMVKFAGGRSRWLDLAMRPIRDAEGTIIAIVPEAIETTDRREAEEALRRSQKLEAMGQLTGGVAHDFNNLLTPILGSLDLLQRRGVGGDRERRLIEGGLQSAERARTLVQRLLAFARRQPLQPQPVDVAALIADMTDLIATTSGPRIRVVIDVAKGLPAATAEANQLEMALLNLAVNARDAMAEGGVLTIAAAAAMPDAASRDVVPGHYVRITVSDTGTGMDAATVLRAIEPFFSTKGVGRGTGLGLSMVHGLASQLGGSLTIASKPGLGTSVDLWLPATGQPVAGEAAARERQAGGTAAGRALLVDDEELVRASTADMLSELGYDVVEAASGEEALKVLDQWSVDLLVTDHLMPGMSGTALAQTVRRRRPDMPVLVITGYADADGIAADLPRLTKPFRSADLSATLDGLSSAGRDRVP